MKWIVRAILGTFSFLKSKALQLAIESRVKRKNVKFDENKPKREARWENKIEKIERRGERRRKKK